MSKKEDLKLKDILTISGQPGLLIYVAQSNNGMIVESLLDGRRFNAPATAKVSSMGEITIYTEMDDMPLSEIFESLYAHTGGKETINNKSTPDQMKTLFAKVVPTYDRDRVHVSDMKKIISWYNMLIAYGITDFSNDEEEENEEQEKKSEPTKEKKAERKVESAQDKKPAKKPAATAKKA